MSATSPRSSSSSSAPLPLRALTGAFAGTEAVLVSVRVVSWLPARGGPGGPAGAAGGWAALAWLPRFSRRRRSGPDTTNSSAENPATAIPDHTFGENTKPVAKTPIATPHRQVAQHQADAGQASAQRQPGDLVVARHVLLPALLPQV